MIPIILASLWLMPQPASLAPGQGKFPIRQGLKVELPAKSDPVVERAAARFLANLSRQTGMGIQAPGKPEPAPGISVRYGHASPEVPRLGEDESYTLTVTSGSVLLDAPTSTGVLRGFETILQLVDQDASSFFLPAVKIEDKPRFPWRGLLIDVARHWMPMDVIKRNLDGMAAVKLNVFHWHLIDDQGVRIESKRYPKLQELGSDGKYFTQEEVREVIRYAADRGIRVLPEFDIPGHTTALLTAYPELASGPGPFQIYRKWGIGDPTMNPIIEETYTFLDGFIGEMAVLFPDAYFHIGGDEVNGKQWISNPQIAEYKKAHGMKNNDDLQVYFNRRVLDILKKYGKTMIGWDEILHPDLPKDIVVHSWRGQKSLAVAARQGNRGLMSHGYYLDLMQPASYHYANDPLEKETASLTPEEKARILGGEACMWAEFVNPETVDSRLWPRLGVIAERLWSPGSVKDEESMYRRMNALSVRLDWLGLQHRSNYGPMLERLSGGRPTKDLRAVDAVLEPVKMYKRTSSRTYFQYTPLNRFVDATRPESEAARQFGQLIAQSKWTEAAAWLTDLRQSATKAAPLFEDSALLGDAQPMLGDIESACKIGLAAIEMIRTHKRPPAGWGKQQLAKLNFPPRAELTLAIQPHVRKLVETASAGR